MGVLRTKLCDFFGIDYPLIQAGIGEAGGPTLVSAACNAGILGVLGGSVRDPEELRDWIRETKRRTKKPFGVNLLMPEKTPDVSPSELEAQIPATHTQFVKKLMQDLQVPETEKPLHWALSPSFYKSQFDVVVEEEIPFLFLGTGTPDWAVEKAHAAGMKVASLVGNTKHARRVVERGVDMVIAQGYEAGGHTGRIGTFVLVPQVVDAVSPVPVLAAGGVGDGRGLVAALALGAVGAWIGTAFLATKESLVDSIGHSAGGLIPSEGFNKYYKQRIVEADEESTVVARFYTGKTVRMLLPNRYIEAWEKSGLRALPMPQQSLANRRLLEGLAESGKWEYLCCAAGQVSGLIKGIKSAKQVVDDMVREATEILNVKFPSGITVSK